MKISNKIASTFFHGCWFRISRMMVLFIFLCHTINAQVKPLPENKIKAVFLYNFTRFIDWPEGSFESANAPLVIGIIGTDPFGDYIEEAVRDEMVSGHPIVIQRYEEMDQIACHILYINEGDAERTKKIIDNIKNKSILTVSDKSNFTKWGGMVQFYTEEDKIKLQINISASQRAGLSISSKLLGVAKIY